MNRKMKIAIPIAAGVIAIGTGVGLAAAKANARNDFVLGSYYDAGATTPTTEAGNVRFRGPGFARPFRGLANEVTAGRIASLLGMTTADLKTQLQAGKTLADIAKDKGVSHDKLVQTILAPFSDRLDILVKYGYLTKDQAATRLKQAQERVNKLVTSKLPANPGPRKGWGRSGPHGRMMGPGGVLGRW